MNMCVCVGVGLCVHAEAYMDAWVSMDANMHCVTRTLTGTLSINTTYRLVEVDDLIGSRDQLHHILPCLHITTNKCYPLHSLNVVIEVAVCRLHSNASSRR